MSKFRITIESFTPRCRNTLRGFCMVKIEELHLLLGDVAIHTKNGQSWAQLPMRPWIKDGQVVVGDDGKPKYFAILDFDNTKVRDAFSDPVVKALLEHNPHALECRETVP
jgi:hypothetical protein